MSEALRMAGMCAEGGTPRVWSAGRETGEQVRLGLTLSRKDAGAEEGDVELV